MTMEKQNKKIFYLSCLIYCLAAMFINCFGQASTSIMNSLAISQSEIGTILTYQAISGILTAFYLSIYGEKYNKVKTIVFASIMLGLGCLLVFVFSFTSNTYNLTFIALMIANIGYTTIDLTINSLISEKYADNKNKYLPIVHTFYGLGSLFIPSFYLLSTSFNSNNYIYAYLALAIIIIFVTALFISDLSKTNKSISKSINDPYEVLKTFKAWILLLVALLFAIFQTGIQSWLSDYNLSVLHLNSNYSSIIITSFFTGALIMRLLSTKILTKIKNHNYYFICSLISGLCLILAMHVDNTVLYTFLLILCGFFQGGLVPTYMIIATDSFPNRQSSSSAIFVLAIGFSNLLSKVYGLIIESYSHNVLMIIIAICLISSGIIIKLLNSKHI